MIHVFCSPGSRHSGASGHSTRSDGKLAGPGSILSINPQTPSMTQPETLRQKAFAKLRLFNFSLNWDLHMNQCKWVENWICLSHDFLYKWYLIIFRPRSLLTRRLYRSRKYDDNELYRSNSFRFQRFERNMEEMDRRISKQVSFVWKQIPVTKVY